MAVSKRQPTVEEAEIAENFVKELNDFLNEIKMKEMLEIADLRTKGKLNSTSAKELFKIINERHEERVNYLVDWINKKAKKKAVSAQ
jgi:predicted RNA-binding protein with RPS1 domain